MPRDQRPPHIQQEYARAEFDRGEDARIYRLAAYLESKIPDAPLRADGTRRRKPCIGVGIIANQAGGRWDIITISGNGKVPDEVRAELQPGQIVIDEDGLDLHAELRIVHQVGEWNKQGRGLRIESIAAAFPICWKLCQPVMDGAGIRAASPRKRRPPDAETPPPKHGRSQLPVTPPGHQKTRGRRPRR